MNIVNKLPLVILLCFLSTSGFAQESESANTVDQFKLVSKGKSITVSTTRTNGISEIKITPSGFRNNIIKIIETDGRVGSVKVADLNQDNYDEFYIVVYSGGSDGSADIIAFQITSLDTLEEISFDKVKEGDASAIGYVGHDEYVFNDTSLSHNFNLYNFSDAKCCPTAGKRTVQYELQKIDGKPVLKAVRFWGNIVSDPGPKNKKAFIEALEYIEKQKIRQTNN